MNTRERERALIDADLACNLRALQDALRKAWGDGTLPASVIPAELARETTRNLAAYDALLAEGSASSEGAEAVAWREIRPDGKPVDANGCYYPGSGPTGRTLSYIRDRGGSVEYVYAGSDAELRAIATEMRDRKVNNGRNTSPTLEAWAQRIETALATAELPAGSDAKLRDALKAAREEITNPVEGHDGGHLTLAVIEQIDAALDTAEQPSCGQDARDGWQPIETAPKDRRIALYCPKRGEVIGEWNDNRHARKPKPYWTNDREYVVGVADTRADQPTHWRERSVPAAIAAQQRQGEQK